MSPTKLSSCFTIITFTLIIIATLTPPARPVELQCQFRTSAWWPGPSYYECDDSLSSINTEAEANITDVQGTHMEGKTNDDIKSFYAYRKTMVVFPRHLEKFFKNLELIAIVSEKLQKIEQADLQPFYKLRVLYLDSNQLEVLQTDLFKFNPNIEAINFSNNRIRHVDVIVFKHLVNLKSLWFENNACHSNKVSDSAFGVAKVIDEIRERCFVDNILTNLQLFQETELAALKADIVALRLENSQLKSKLEDLRVENAKVVTERSHLNANLAQCNAEKEEVKMEIKNCRHEIIGVMRPCHRANT